MAIRLDHVIVPSRDPVASARLLAGLLDVPWEKTRGHFTPVYVNETLTLDFASRDDAGMRADLREGTHHYCFHVSEGEFDAILGRIETAGIAYRSEPGGPTDRQINRRLGGKNLYWQDDDGHLWEILTVSYARADSPLLTPTG
jgi:catechol 2,3-dioxygenase-like lactoylglutathione lyase family enzyme